MQQLWTPVGYNWIRRCYSNSVSKHNMASTQNTVYTQHAQFPTEQEGESFYLTVGTFLTHGSWVGAPIKIVVVPVNAGSTLQQSKPSIKTYQHQPFC